jgi:hypothetical protein
MIAGQAGVLPSRGRQASDLAAWVSRLDGLDDVAECGHGPAVHEIEVFLLEPGTNRYLGRLCYFQQCPAGKRDCLAAGCGHQPFLKQHDDFSLYPEAIGEGAAIRLYDRIGGGIIARAVNLQLIVLDDDP